jgi:hypothetical protein
MSKEEEIAESGLIAYCIIMFSEHIVLNIVMAERLKEEVIE